MTRMLWALLALIVAVGAVFAIWPGLDLTVSREIFDRMGFIGGDARARIGRQFFSILPFVVFGVLAASYLARRLGLWAPFAPTGRAVLFLTATLAIGPGLIVNLGLKDHMHRPRPVHVTEFGGAKAFRPWYRFDGACAKNCGFPSGEASSGFWMVAPALLAPPPLQAPAIAAALAFGAHFLSDVLFGALISLIVIFTARRILWPRGGP